MVLEGIASPHTRRAYTQALEESPSCLGSEPREFNKAAVQKQRTEREAKRLAPSSINVRLAAIRRLALEAADNGLMPPELAAGMGRTKGARRAGVRPGSSWRNGQPSRSGGGREQSTLDFHSQSQKRSAFLLDGNHTPWTSALPNSLSRIPVSFPGHGKFENEGRPLAGTLALRPQRAAHLLGVQCAGVQPKAVAVPPGGESVREKCG